MTQLKLDISSPHFIVDDEKKTELISFRVGEKFKNDLNAVALAKGIGLSELIHIYSSEGYLEDYKTTLFLQTIGHKIIKDKS